MLYAKQAGILHATHSLLLSTQANHERRQYNLARVLHGTYRQVMRAMKLGLRPTAIWCSVKVMTRAAQRRAPKSTHAALACGLPALVSPPQVACFPSGFSASVC